MKEFVPDPALEPLREIIRQEIIGLTEGAAISNVKQSTPDMWNFRGILLEPLMKVGGTPIWLRSDWIAWLKHTGRMREE